MAARKSSAKSISTILGIPLTKANVIFTMFAGIGAIVVAFAILPTAWSVARYGVPAWIGYVDGKVEQTQAPVLQSLREIQDAQTRNRLAVIQDDLLKVEIEIARTGDPAQKATKNFQRNKLLKEQTEQEEMLKNLGRAKGR